MKMISRKWVYTCLVTIICTFVLSVKSISAATYPPITYDFNDFEWITNVTFGAINNDSFDGVDGYEDFTSGMSASVTPGVSYDLFVTIESDFDDNISAFFDWNGDGDFSDPGEEVVVATLVDTVGPHSVSVSVPADAVTGETRMRVALRLFCDPVSFGDPVPVCPESGVTDGSDGEAEDYTIFIPGPTITATAGANGSITPAGVVQKSSGDSQTFIITPDFSYSVADVFVDGVSVGPLTSYTFDNIAKSHTILANFGFNFWPLISSATFDLEWITNVTFGVGAINNSSGSEGYANFSGGTATTVSPGTSYPLSVLIHPSIEGDENVSTFFDWNRDGDFLDPGEEVVVAQLVNTVGPHTVSVSVPPGAVAGETRMRVVLRYVDSPPSSGVIDWGEAEDYTVIVRPTITATAGPNGSISPSGAVVVNDGDTQAFTITPDINYHIGTVSGCGGALVGNIFTTGPITVNCSVDAIFAIDTYTVTPVAGANGSLNPATPQNVAHGLTTAFTVNPAANYHIDTVVGCGGTLVGNTFTTGAITGNCSVTASFAIDTFTVTPTAGANGNINPSIPQTVDYGSITAFTVTPSANYHIDTITGCGGTLVNSTFTTVPVTADCAVNATFAIDTYTVTPSAGLNGSITPSVPQTVDYGATPAFTVVADGGYHIDSVIGCGGTLVGNTFTTGPVTADCAVNATFAVGDAYSLSVGIIGSGKGGVTSDPAGIDCTTDTCVEPFGYGTVVTLTATPADGSDFVGWAGDCTGEAFTCTVTMDQVRSVTANFYSFPWNLFLPAILNNANSSQSAP